MLNTYQDFAVGEGVDLLGHDMAPPAYAQLQILEQAVRGVGSFDDAKHIAYARNPTFDTVLGPITFGADGEWRKSHMLQVQFRGLSAASLEPLRSGQGYVVVAPDEFASGVLAYPYW